MDTTAAPASPATADLVSRFVAYAQNTFVPALASFYSGGAAHVGTVSVVPDDIMPANVGAFFITASPDGTLLEALTGGEVTPITAMYVTMDTAITVAAALEGSSRSLPDDLRREVLTDFKTQLKFVVHEATHSIGPNDINAFEAEVERTARGGLGPWKEAVTELSTQRNLNALIGASGLDQCDPWLLDVESRDTGSYVGMVEAAEAVIDGLTAMIPGADPDVELRSLVSAGCGRTGLEQLLGRALEARGRKNPELVNRARMAIAESLRALDRQYKRTLSALDGADDVTVSTVMSRLSREGRREGGHILDRVEALIAAPARPTTPRRSGRSIERLVTRHLGSWQASPPRLGPPPEAGSRQAAGATLHDHG
jgi:hypothetical protein